MRARGGGNLRRKVWSMQRSSLIVGSRIIKTRPETRSQDRRARRPFPQWAAGQRGRPQCWSQGRHLCVPPVGGHRQSFVSGPQPPPLCLHSSQVQCDDGSEGSVRWGQAVQVIVRSLGSSLSPSLTRSPLTQLPPSGKTSYLVKVSDTAQPDKGSYTSRPYQEKSSRPTVQPAGSPQSEAVWPSHRSPSSALVTNTSSSSVTMKCLLPYKPGALPAPACPITRTSLAS